MRLLELMKTSGFWKRTLLIGLPLFLFLTLFSVLFNNFSALLEMDFSTVYTRNFAEGRWFMFLLSKLIISLVYAIWMAQRSIDKKG